MMQLKDILRKNIRDLRKAHGESQQELGRTIGYEHNMISMIESGARDVSMETLQAIASHYGYPLDQLIRADFSELNYADLALTWENVVSMIKVVLPLLVSDKALEDECFAKGYKFTQEIADSFSKADSVIMRSVFERAMDAYAESLEKYETKESAANMLWLIYVQYSLLPDEHWIAIGKAIQFGKAHGKDFVKKYVLSKEKNITEAQKTNKMQYARDLSGSILAFIEFLKSSPEYANIADYYLALRYIIGIVDTDYSQEINQIIGMEMMLSYLSLGNPYAFSYFKKALFK
ncbi:helix-turn-helix domain-containing protein [Paenibacillus sp. LMG 31458]|uniref:Helix-turn-helix domain-containing protein n=1 Tax=Paenibacillus phytorum TaxID=2654977 RepID=A0ABX1XXZ8_9BACL|nr:helix-turn-helix transcriptional regulator [Paenibacillus phytorum]NOU73440.1 helix-turn-helix domain-containing protein [Paenibacillus phytorum]